MNVWLVPFALFVSLSAGENVLPSMGSEYATGRGSSFVSAGVGPAATTTSAGGDGGYGYSGGGYGAPDVGGSSGGIKTRHKRSNTQTGMAKAAVMGVQDWVGETGELMGFWKGERTRPL